MREKLGTRLEIVLGIAALAVAMSAGVAFGAPVLRPGVVSAPGMSGVCTDCHRYAKSTPPAANSPSAEPPSTSRPSASPRVVNPPRAGEDSDNGDVESRDADGRHKATRHHAKSRHLRGRHIRRHRND